MAQPTDAMASTNAMTKTGEMAMTDAMTKTDAMTHDAMATGSAMQEPEAMADAAMLPAWQKVQLTNARTVGQLLEAFILGNAAILGNVCILPLYPGLIVFLAGNADNPRAERSRLWLGAVVLAGVLSMMMLVGLAVFTLQQSFGAILPLLLPAIYITVILLGALMLMGRNPFNRIATSEIPVLRNPVAAAYAYGLLLGPMTLPCTGPLIVTAFVLGAGSVNSLVGALLYFLAFGLGFGWPLIVLPWITASAQKRFTRWFTQNYALIGRLSGLLLIAIGVFGFVTEVVPNL